MMARAGPGLNRLPGDETIVADNTPGGMPGDLLPTSARVVRAAAERSAYHARNAGARPAANDWILFCDADCACATCWPSFEMSSEIICSAEPSQSGGALRICCCV